MGFALTFCFGGEDGCATEGVDEAAAGIFAQGLSGRDRSSTERHLAPAGRPSQTKASLDDGPGHQQKY